MGLLLVGLALLALGWWLGFLSWQLALFAFVSTTANQVHKWAHSTCTEKSRVISLFQDIGLLLMAPSTPSTILNRKTATLPTRLHHPQNKRHNIASLLIEDPVS